MSGQHPHALSARSQVLQGIEQFHWDYDPETDRYRGFFQIALLRSALAKRPPQCLCSNRLRAPQLRVRAVWTTFNRSAGAVRYFASYRTSNSLTMAQLTSCLTQGTLSPFDPRFHPLRRLYLACCRAPRGRQGEVRGSLRDVLLALGGVGGS